MIIAAAVVLIVGLLGSMVLLQRSIVKNLECSAISEELAGRAVELENLVGSFKLHRAK